MAKNFSRAAEKIPARYTEDDFPSPTPIEQQLDMVEGGELERGDEVEFSHGRDRAPPDRDGGMKPLDTVLGEYNVNMAEENREGDEMTGDEHSFGLQGEEPEMLEQPHIDSGIPGEDTLKEPRRK